MRDAARYCCCCCCCLVTVILWWCRRCCVRGDEIIRTRRRRWESDGGNRRRARASRRSCDPPCRRHRPMYDGRSCSTVASCRATRSKALDTRRIKDGRTRWRISWKREYYKEGKKKTTTTHACTHAHVCSYLLLLQAGNTHLCKRERLWNVSDSIFKHYINYSLIYHVHTTEC